MPISQGDMLFGLIQSLTKAEKRNFKLYIRRLQNEGEVKFFHSCRAAPAELGLVSPTTSFSKPWTQLARRRAAGLAQARGAALKGRHAGLAWPARAGQALF